MITIIIIRVGVVSWLFFGGTTVQLGDKAGHSCRVLLTREGINFGQEQSSRDKGIQFLISSFCWTVLSGVGSQENTTILYFRTNAHNVHS